MAICMVKSDSVVPLTDRIFHDTQQDVRIATPRGEKPIETLQPGDRVITRDNGLQQIRWVGRRRLSGPELQRAPHLWPVLIRAASLGYGLPERDMLVSPQHRLLLSGEREGMVAARYMTAMQEIDQTEYPEMTCIHFMCEHHEMVLLNGIWIESFRPDEEVPNGVGAAQRAEICEIFPELRAQSGVHTCHVVRHAPQWHEARVMR